MSNTPKRILEGRGPKILENRRKRVAKLPSEERVMNTAAADTVRAGLDALDEQESKVRTPRAPNPDLTKSSVQLIDLPLHTQFRWQNGVYEYLQDGDPCKVQRLASFWKNPDRLVNFTGIPIENFNPYARVEPGLLGIVWTPGCKDERWFNRDELRALFRQYGGTFHGPHVEHANCKEQGFFQFLHALQELLLQRVVDRGYRGALDGIPLGRSTDGGVQAKTGRFEKPDTDDERLDPNDNTNMHWDKLANEMEALVNAEIIADPEARTSVRMMSEAIREGRVTIVPRKS